MTALQNRIKAEKAITKADYSIQLWDSEEMHKGLTAKQALDLAMDLDECKIYAYRIIDGVKSIIAIASAVLLAFIIVNVLLMYTITLPLIADQTFR